MKINSLKIVVILIFITGVLQIEILNINWEYLTKIRATHILGSIPLVIFLVIPFIIKHSYQIVFIKKLKNIDGFVLYIVSFTVIISGFYLFFIGQRDGNIFGIIAFYSHLFGSFLFIFSLIYHIKKISSVLILFALIIINPINVKSEKLHNIKIDAKRYHSEDWTNSTKCKSCHTDIFNQWADSNHRNIVSSNPYYMVQEALAAKDMGEDFRQWCMGCHNPSAVTTKQKATSHKMNTNFLANEIFDSGAKILQNDFKKYGNFQLEEGVSCVACHTIDKATKKGNASYKLNLRNRKKYTFENSNFSLGKYLSERFINSKPNIHKKSYSKEIYKSSIYCASCHNESLPNHKNINKNAIGKKIVSTYDEWEQSSFNNPNNPSKHKTCIDCHMATIKNTEFDTTTRVHYFSGANYFLSGLKNSTHKKQTIALLKTSAKLSVKIVNSKIKIGVTNIGAGHHLPTGVADFRELWLEIEVKDKDNNIIFTSGKLDKNAELKKGTRIFKKVFGNKDGKPVGLLFWRYEKLLSDTRIPAGKTRIETYILSKDLVYPIEITVKLNFRIYPQYITTIVQRAYPFLPNPPIIELNRITKKFINANEFY